MITNEKPTKWLKREMMDNQACNKSSLSNDKKDDKAKERNGSPDSFAGIKAPCK